jgi:hypothetical protein
MFLGNSRPTIYGRKGAWRSHFRAASLTGVGLSSQTPGRRSRRDQSHVAQADEQAGHQPETLGRIEGCWPACSHRAWWLNRLRRQPDAVDAPQPLVNPVPTGENLAHQTFFSTLRRRQVLEKWRCCGGSIKSISVERHTLKGKTAAEAAASDSELLGPKGPRPSAKRVLRIPGCPLRQILRAPRSDGRSVRASVPRVVCHAAVRSSSSRSTAHIGMLRQPPTSKLTPTCGRRIILRKTASASSSY